MRNKFFELIDFKDGRVTYDSFDIDPLLPISEQEFSLREDLLQVEYGSYLLDVGWLPDGNPKGRFVVRLIHNYDWESPVQKVEAKNLTILKERLQEVIDYAEALLSHVHA